MDMRPTPDWIIRQAARLLQASPGMWGELADAMGGNLKIPLAMPDQNEQQDPNPIHVQVDVCPHNVFLSVPRQPNEPEESFADRDDYGLMVENWQGELVLYAYDLSTGYWRYKHRIWPLPFRSERPDNLAAPLQVGKAVT
jgi:hypothetical protein